MAREAEDLPHPMRSDSDASDDEDNAPALPPAGQPRRDRLERIALFDFLRLVAGNREPAAEFRTNEDLVRHLKSNGTLTSDTVSRAMLACPRDLFVPSPYRGEALLDRPVRVEAAGFNISAPHVQAVSLQALEIQPGQRVLDVGCGCGIVTAYAAYLAGSGGHVVGIDVRDTALRMASSNLDTLRERNLEFSEVSAPISLERHNVFVPVARHTGRYDAVHVGGAAPESRIGVLLELLGPGGGRIVVPTSTATAGELRLYVKSPRGSVSTRVLSQVSFSELEVPRDVEVVHTLLQEQAEAARRVGVPPSTFASDLAHLAAPGADLGVAAAAGAPAEGSAAAGPLGSGEGHCRRSYSGGVRSRSRTSLSNDHQQAATLAPAHRAAARAPCQRDVEAAEGTWERGGATSAEKSVTAAREELAGSSSAVDAEAGERRDSGLVDWMGSTKAADAEAAPAGPMEAEGSGGGGGDGSDLSYMTSAATYLALGPPDCVLIGPGWSLPAHKAVLQARCELLRAQQGSGMRDSDTATFAVPEVLESREAVEAFLHYVYKDCLPPGGVEPVVMPQLLHAGIYYGCHRLVRLCESLLARELVLAGEAAGAHDPEVLGAAVAAAGPLLAMADEGGLDALRGVAMQFILDHFSEVSASEGYQQLPRPLVDKIAGEAVSRYGDLLRQLERLAAEHEGGGGDVDGDDGDDE